MYIPCTSMLKSLTVHTSVQYVLIWYNFASAPMLPESWGWEIYLMNVWRPWTCGVCSSTYRLSGVLVPFVAECASSFRSLNPLCNVNEIQTLKTIYHLKITFSFLFLEIHDNVTEMMKHFHSLCTLLLFTLKWFYIYNLEESIILSNSKFWIWNWELGIKLLVNGGLCEKRKTKGIKAICSQTGELFCSIYNTAAVMLLKSIFTLTLHTPIKPYKEPCQFRITSKVRGLKNQWWQKISVKKYKLLSLSTFVSEEMGYFSYCQHSKIYELQMLTHRILMSR